MTEAEWLGCENPVSVLQHGWETASDRKRRLLGCAFCRSVWTLLKSEKRHAVQLCEKYADGEDDGRVFRETELYLWPRPMWGAMSDPRLAKINWLPHMMGSVSACQSISDSGQATGLSGSIIYAPMVRDIFGNPFRPVVLDPAWRTSVVLALAEGIYAERAVDRLPILADALQEAGCDHPDVLDHCRGPGPHARGCWVMDLILGKA